MSNLTDIIGSQYNPTLCLVVYKRSKAGHDNDYYLESHDVNSKGEILAGRPLLQETLNGMVDVFFDERQNNSQVAGLFPAELLSFKTMPGGRYEMVWYRPAEERVLFHKPELKLPDAVKAWVPATLYHTNGRSLSVLALPSNSRPTAETRLLEAPYFNVGDNGDVCLGNANRTKPPKTYEGIIAYWEDLFWKSEATHLNGGEKVVKGSLADAWKQKIKTGAKWSPKELQKTGLKLKNWL